MKNENTVKTKTIRPIKVNLTPKTAAILGVAVRKLARTTGASLEMATDVFVNDVLRRYLNTWQLAHKLTR